MKEGSEIGKRKGGEVRAVEGVWVEVENRTTGGGSGGGEDGLRNSGADDNEIVGRRIKRRIGREVAHGGSNLSGNKLRPPRL